MNITDIEGARLLGKPGWLKEFRRKIRVRICPKHIPSKVIITDLEGLVICEGTSFNGILRAGENAFEKFKRTHIYRN